MTIDTGDGELPTVTCLRCGAVYPEGAIVCFRCGAPIGEASSATQPVRPFQAIPPSSDFPSGAQPPVLQMIEQDEISTAPRLAAVRVATKRKPTGAQRWEHRGRVVLALIILVVVAAAIAGTAVGVKALLAGDNVSHSTTYQDPLHRFHFLRPTLWTVTPLPDGVLVTDSEGASTLQVSVATPAPGETAQGRADAMAQTQGLADDTSLTFAGVEWQARVGNVTGRDGVVRQLDVYVAEHNGVLYIIQLASPIASFNGIDNLVYQPMLASFQFT